MISFGLNFFIYLYSWDFPGGAVVKILPSNPRSAGLIPVKGAKSSHVSWPKNQNRKNINSIITNPIKTFKMAHLKKKTKIMQ